MKGSHRGENYHISVMRYGIFPIFSNMCRQFALCQIPLLKLPQWLKKLTATSVCSKLKCCDDLVYGMGMGRFLPLVIIIICYVYPQTDYSHNMLIDSLYLLNLLYLFQFNW